MKQDVAEAAASRKQRSDVRNQNFKGSPMATIFKTMNNVGDLDALLKRTGAVNLR